MSLYKRKKHNKKYLIWAIIITLLVLMIISFTPNTEITETVLFP